MEELAEVSPTSDSQAEGPEEPDSRLSAAAPGPPEAVSDPGPLQIDGLLGALRSRLQRTAAILAMTKAAAVPERGAAANPTPMRPPMTPPCSVAGSTAKAKGEGRPTPGPAVWPPMPASSATPAVWPAMPASSATPAVWAPPGPASSASSTTPAVWAPPAASSASSTTPSTPGPVMAKHQTGAYPAKNVAVLPFKRQNVSPSERWELDRRNRKEKRRKDRRDRERQNEE